MAKLQSQARRLRCARIGEWGRGSDAFSGGWGEEKTLRGLLICAQAGGMKFTFRRFDWCLAHRWMIARGLEPGGEGGTDVFKVAFAELTDRDGVAGWGNRRAMQFVKPG